MVALAFILVAPALAFVAVAELHESASVGLRCSPFQACGLALLHSNEFVVLFAPTPAFFSCVLLWKLPI